MQFFSSYKEAHEILNLPGSWQQGTIGNETTGITSIKLTENPKSYDRITKDLQTIYYVGRGSKSSPGEPANSQTKTSQTAFYTSLHRQTPVWVLIKLKSGFVLGLGQYRVVSIRKVASLHDFYQIKLLRMKDGI
jgi:hypothetical protein